MGLAIVWRSRLTFWLPYFSDGWLIFLNRINSKRKNVLSKNYYLKLFSIVYSCLLCKLCRMCSTKSIMYLHKNLRSLHATRYQYEFYSPCYSTSLHIIRMKYLASWFIDLSSVLIKKTGETCYWSFMYELINFALINFDRWNEVANVIFFYSFIRKY